MSRCPRQLVRFALGSSSRQGIWGLTSWRERGSLSPIRMPVLDLTVRALRSQHSKPQGRQRVSQRNLLTEKMRYVTLWMVKLKPHHALFPKVNNACQLISTNIFTRYISIRSYSIVQLRPTRQLAVVFIVKCNFNFTQANRSILDTKTFQIFAHATGERK